MSHKTDEEILGRADVNDLEAIIAIVNTDVDEMVHAVKDNADAIFTWDYEKGARPALDKLYEKAKHSQWNGETDLDWSIEVDPEKRAVVQTAGRPARPARSQIIGRPTPTRRSRTSATRSGSSSASSRSTGASASSCTASRAR